MPDPSLDLPPLPPLPATPIASQPAIIKNDQALAKTSMPTSTAAQPAPADKPSPAPLEGTKANPYLMFPTLAPPAPMPAEAPGAAKCPIGIGCPFQGCNHESDFGDVKGVQAKGSLQMTLEQATTIALENSEIVRVLQMRGTPSTEDGSRGWGNIVISRLKTDGESHRFVSEMSAMLRSVEQQYWALALHHMQLWSRETAFALGEQVVKREQADYALGRGGIASLAEAQQQLERFRLDVISATSDVITTERQLRNILGMPPTDDRRIIPVTAPTEEPFTQDWLMSLKTMLDHQPDIQAQRFLVKLAEAKLDEAGKQWNAADDDSIDQARRNVFRQRAFLDQVVKQTTHSLARFHLEIASNSNGWKAAERNQKFAAARLNVQRSRYEAGRVSVDRYLDAIAQWAGAVTLEMQYKCQYNTAIIAYHEAVGDLLDYDAVSLHEPSGDLARATIHAQIQLKRSLDLPVKESASKAKPSPAHDKDVQAAKFVEPVAEPEDAKPTTPLPIFKFTLSHPIELRIEIKASKAPSAPAKAECESCPK